MLQRRSGPGLVGLCLALALSACSSDSSDAPTASSTGSPSVGSPAATPGTSSPSTSPPKASPAPGASTPTGPVRRPARDGDVDGDGTPDEVSATIDALTVRLSGGGTLTAPVEADAEPPVQGVVDLDRDGRAEVFLETTRGASTVFYTPYRYDGTTLRPLRIEGEVARLGVGGSVSHGDGFACAPDGRLVLSSSTSEDGESFDVVTTALRTDGDALVTLSRRVANGLRQGDPRVAASYQVDCGSVTQDG